MTPTEALTSPTNQPVDAATLVALRRLVGLRVAGGPGSGNFGHAGRPGEVGGSGEGGNGSDAVSHADFAAQSAVGIAAVEKLLDHAVSRADFSSVEGGEATWENLSPLLQDETYDQFREDAYGDLFVDTADIDADFERDLRKDNGEVIEATEKDALERLANDPAFSTITAEQKALPILRESALDDKLHPDLTPVRLIDPETLTVDEDTGDGAQLTDLQEIRFTNGDTLTEIETAKVQQSWDKAYSDNFDQAMADVRESNAYSDARSELEQQEISDQWDNMSDEQKLALVNEDDRLNATTGVSAGLPDTWVTGVSESNNDDSENYGRTHAVALALVEARTAQLFEERGIDLGGGLPRNTAENLASKTWDEWKGSSTSDIGLALQLATANELGGVHRMTESEVARAMAALSGTPGNRDIRGGMPAMQAYVRAQWETTQFVMQKAGEEHVEVYRGLMLPKTSIESTTITYFDKFNEPITETPTQVQRDFGGQGFAKLPDLMLQRGGAQSTTGTRSVANDWGGVGVKDKMNTDRVVLRIVAPRTSVLSLPVYGQNAQSEHEVVLTGSKDRWSWDAWKGPAPDFDTHPVTKAALKSLAKRKAQAKKKTTKLVIDLQDIDRGQPHWLRDTPDAVVIRARERRRKTIKTLAKHETLIHAAADAHLAKMTVALEYAFARGRKALGRNANVDAAVKAIRVALEEVLQPTLLKAVAAGGEAGLAHLKKMRAAAFRTAKPSPVVAINIRFDAKNKHVISWADKHAAELVTSITETTREAINNAVAEHQETGDFDEAYDEILAAVGSTSRADLIARTETMLAANHGQREAWDQAVDAKLLTGDEKVAWIVTPINPCEECESLDGETRDIDGEYPDPGGDGPPLHPNCRCTEGLV